MKLRALQVYSVPGIDQPFRIEPETRDGTINLLTGPNGSGKTTVLRAIRGLLYPRLTDAEWLLAGTFLDADGRTLEVRNTGGTTTWYRAGQRIDPPHLPEERFAGCYMLTFEDVAGLDSDSERAVAARLARELTGGYDVRAVRRAFEWSAQRARKPAKAFEQARRERDAVKREQGGLGRDEARLEELQQELDAARERAAAVPRIEAAQDYLAARDERARVEAELAQLPKGVEHLQGDDVARLESLKEAIAAAEARREQARKDRRAAEGDRDATGLAGSAVDRDALQQPRAWLQQLESAAQRLEDARGQLEDAEAAVRARRGELGGDPDRTPAPVNAGTVRRAASALHTWRERAIEKRRLEQQRDELPSEREESASPETLRSARDALRAWLAAHDSAGRTSRRWVDWVALGIPLALAAGAAAWRIHWSYALLVAAGALGLVLHQLRLDPRRGERAARERFEASGLEAPADWTPESVRDALEAAEARLQRAEREEEAVERRRGLQRRIDALQDTLEGIESGLGGLAGEMGFDPRQLDAGLLAWLDAVEYHRQAVARREQARQQVETAGSRVASWRESVAGFLRAHELAPTASTPEPDELRAGLDRLEKRIERRDEAQARIEHEDRRMREAAEETERLRRQLGALFAERGLAEDDEQGLRLRAERFARYQELRDQRTAAVAREHAARERLADPAWETLLALAEAGESQALEARLQEARRAADEAARLSDEIAEINARVRQAQQDRRLATAEAEVQRARDELERAREDALHQTAGAFLVDEVEREVQAVQRPQALARAQAWFEAFTRYAFGFDIEPGDPPRFVAHDHASGATLGLGALSSGTRMQLLLAIRMGFALHAEGERGRLPLFVDHVLATSDPERFAQVAEAFRQVARDDGRQVFYLTADPAEASRWRQVLGDEHIHEIDVAEARGRAGALTDAGDVLEPPPTPLPDPGIDGEEALVEALAVAPVDPWREADAQHVFYVLRDRPARLRQVAQLGVRSIGQLRTMLARDALDEALEPGERGLLEARITGIAEWLAAWRQGRGHPISRAVLADSPMQRSSKFEDIVAKAEAVGWDPQALLDGLRAREVAGVRERMIDELEEYLRHDDRLPTRPALAPEERRQRVAEVLAGELGLEDAGDETRRLVARLERGVEARAAAGEAAQATAGAL